MRRIFVAVDISDEARERAADYIGNLSNDEKGAISWVRPDKLHLTLRFIGRCTDEDVVEVSEAIKSVAKNTDAFSLKIVGTGVFPNPRGARVLWLDVGGDIEQMTNAVRLFDQEYKAEEGLAKFKPHLMIARVKDPLKGREVIKKHLESQFEPVEFEVAEIVVYESKLYPKGSIYSVVSKHKLR